MSEENNLSQSVEWFRQASPYINAHRGKIFVITLSGDAVSSVEFPALIHDIALLSHLGIKLVLVYGIRSQIAQKEARTGNISRVVAGMRITDDDALITAKEVAGRVRVEIESAISSSLPNTPMSGSRLGIVSGNFVTARPYGIHNGIDYGHTGVIRNVHTDAIKKQLEAGNIVLLSPLGYSPTGESFNLFAEDVATETAISLGAEKLVFLLDKPILMKRGSSVLRQSTPSELQSLLKTNSLSATSAKRCLENTIRACNHSIKRAHLIDRHIDGALLKEFFTRDGIGTLVNADNYEDIHPATINDIGGIIELISPLEEDGTLVRRSREQLEMDIEFFTIIERDSTVIACALLYETGDFGELACVVTHPDYRSSGHAETLLEYLENKAKNTGLKKLFVFTTRTKHWFIEQGFRAATLDSLPAARQSNYNLQRNSSLLIKSI